MNRSIAIASIVGGVVLAVGMLFIPFSTDVPGTALDISTDSSEAAGATDCSTLFSHYVSGSQSDACSGVANDRVLMVVAGIVVAGAGVWTLRRAG